MENISKSHDLRKIFYNTELWTSVIKYQNLDLNILYRCCKFDTELFFLFFDFENLFFSHQNIDYITKLNKELNSSLEFDLSENLLDFLIENLFKNDDALIVTKVVNVLKFEKLIDIIKVKWQFDCIELREREIISSLFIKPLFGMLFSFQTKFNNNNTLTGCNLQVFNCQDLLQGMNQPNFIQNKTFNTQLTELSKYSTNIYTKKQDQEKNLKRKYDETFIDGKDDLNTKSKKLSNKKTKYKNDKEDTQNSTRKSKNEKTKKDPENISDIPESFSSLSNEDKSLQINKNQDKKKKAKLKFV